MSNISTFFRSKKALYSGFLVFIFIGILTSCQHNRFDNINVSDVLVEPVVFKRLDRDLFQMNPDSIKLITPRMIEKYGTFYARFVTSFLNNAGLNDSSYAFNLKNFIADKDMYAAFDEIQKQYPDLSKQETELTDVYKRFRYFFPDRYLPKPVAYMSGFNYAVAYSDSTLGVGLEMYLGGNSPFYKMMALPGYKTRCMSNDYIMLDLVRGWVSSEFVNNELKNDLLSQLVHEGKLMFLTKLLLPQKADTVLLKYNNEQWNWCKKNENNIWTFLVQQNMVYTTDGKEIMKFLADGPYTASFGRESAPRIGQWIGWRIVESYMNHQDDVSIEELMKENDAQKILKLSKYKPK